MNVVSLFDGISCARVALQRAEINVKKYFAFEINEKAIQVSMKNFPDIIQKGSVRNAVNIFKAGDIDLLIGGSPCQNLSSAGDRKGLIGDKSILFWEYVKVLKKLKPKKFIFENVASMTKKDKNIITEALGVEPIMFDSGLVSGQSRKRLFWTNIHGIVLPTGCKTVVKDILLLNKLEGKTTFTKLNSKNNRLLGFVGTYGQHCKVYNINYKSPTLSAGLPEFHKVGEHNIRRLDPIECERLMGLPDNYTDLFPKTHRYHMIGNAFHVDVVAHILKFINNSKRKEIRIKLKKLFP